MRFDPRYHIWEAASDDEARPVLTAVYFDVERATLAATDSYALAEVPCVPEEGDTSGLIPAAALRKAARATWRNGRDAQVTVADGHATFIDRWGAQQRWPLIDGTFPNVVELFERNTETIEEPFGINHKLFGIVTRSLGFSDRGSACIRIHPTNPLHAIYAEGHNGARGIIMPVSMRK
jgi:hypothetical protein